MLIHLRYNRRSAVAYLREMAGRHTGKTAERLAAAADLYQRALEDLLAGELPHPGPTKGGPAAYAAMVERVSKLEANAMADLEAAAASMPKEGRNMECARDRLETKRLVIRGFTHEDWAAIQELAKDLAASHAAKYDHPWPTSEDGCKGAAGYFAKRAGSSWAVCLKTDKRLIGYISYNDIDGDKRLDLGHVFHSRFYCEDYDTEALKRMIDHAFTALNIKSIYCNNAEEWTAQLASLRKLGLKLVPRPKGPVKKSSFRKDEHGNPIEFVGCRMEITRGEWLPRRKEESKTPKEIRE